MLGMPGLLNPLISSIAAGAWLLARRCIEWMKHMASTCFARWGNKSLTHVPDWPCWAQAKGLARHFPLVWKKPTSLSAPGSCSPLRAWSSGL